MLYVQYTYIQHMHYIVHVCCVIFSIYALTMIIRMVIIHIIYICIYYAHENICNNYDDIIIIVFLADKSKRKVCKIMD